jgi:ParB/RepB/Spo0J family partition protein
MTNVTFPHKRELIWVSPDKIVANDNNPRSAEAFQPDELLTLRRSIKANGVWEPLIITPYKGDTYKLIEGERRWTSARLEGVKEVPAQVVSRMKDTEELSVMLQIHALRRGWGIHEELLAIQRLIDASPGESDRELAERLGMPLARFQERRRVLEMGTEIVSAIGRGEIDFSAALRAGDVAKTLARQRPEMSDKYGGEGGVRTRLITKVKVRPAGKGITRELDSIRQDARDTAAVPDDVLEAYIERPQATLSEARAHAKSLEERRAVEDLVKRIMSLNSDLRAFTVDLHEAPNITELRRALASLIDTGQRLEQKIVGVTIDQRES